MLLEVEVNGKPLARAGVGEGSVSAFVTCVKIKDDAKTTPDALSETFLSVAGYLADNTAVHWGNGPNRLLPGDTITIRVVDSGEPDPHTVSPDQS